MNTWKFLNNKRTTLIQNQKNVKHTFYIMIGIYTIWWNKIIANNKSVNLAKNTYIKRSDNGFNSELNISYFPYEITLTCFKMWNIIITAHFKLQ